MVTKIAGGFTSMGADNHSDNIYFTSIVSTTLTAARNTKLLPFGRESYIWQSRRQLWAMKQ